MTSDIDGVRNVVVNTLTSIIQNTATLVVALVAMYQKNWILATLAIIIVPLLTIPTKRVGKRRWSLALEAQKCNDKINQILNETLSVSGQMLVKLFTKEKAEYEKYERVNREMVRLNIKKYGRTLVHGGIEHFYQYRSYAYISCRRHHHYFSPRKQPDRWGCNSNGYFVVQNVYAGKLTSEPPSGNNPFAGFIYPNFEYFDIKPEIENAPDAMIPQTALKNDLVFEDVVFPMKKCTCA